MTAHIKSFLFNIVGGITLFLGLCALAGGLWTLGLGTSALGLAALWYGRRLRPARSDDNTQIRRQKKFRRRLWRDHWQTGAALVGVNVAVFYLCNVNLGFGWSSASSDALLKWGAIFPPLAAHGQAWRFLTATFLHLDAMHLIGNMIALFLVSRYVDYLLGPTQTLLIYLVTGVAAGLAEAAVEPTVLCVGASGAIMGLEGIFLGALFFGRPDGKPLALSKFSAAYLAYHALNSMCEGFGRIGIANAAHVAGFAAGFAIYFVVIKMRWAEVKLNQALVAVTALAFFACQVTVFSAVPSAREGLERLHWSDSLRQLMAKYDRYQDVMKDFDRLVQATKAGQLTDHEFEARTRARIVPRLDKVYAELGALKAASPAIQDARRALYYHVGYTRQSLQMVLDNQVEDQARVVSAARSYATKVNEAFANIAGSQRAPASVPL